MSQVKIRDLPAGSISNNNDLFVVATNSGRTVKIPYSAMASFLFETSLVEGDNITITDVTEQGDIKKYSIAATTTSDNLTVTLTVAGWTGESAPYTQSVNVAGMTSSKVPIIAPSYSDTVSTGLEQKAEWAKITKAVSGTGIITFKCYEEKPTVELTAIVKVV